MRIARLVCKRGGKFIVKKDFVEEESSFILCSVIIPKITCLLVR